MPDAIPKSLPQEQVAKKLKLNAFRGMDQAKGVFNIVHN